MSPRSWSGQAVAAGLTAALVGYASSVAVVVAGLRAGGASPAQATFGLMSAGVVCGIVTVVASATTRIPISIVWSSPGLALLSTLRDIPGGWPVTVGAFMLTGIAIFITSFVRPLHRALSALPSSLLSAVLAGILLPFCLAPMHALSERPLPAAAVVGTWLVVMRTAARFAAPAALVALIVVVLTSSSSGASTHLLLSAEVSRPELSWHGVLSIALPLYLVTMAGQNLVGTAVLVSHGYRPSLPRLLRWTGAVSAAAAPLGSPPVNLAALTAALTAGSTAHADPDKRWQATVASGCGFVVLAGFAPLTTGLMVRADPRLVAAAAGLGLLGAFSASAADCFADVRGRIAASVAFLTTASGIAVGGLSSAPLGLIAGVIVWRLDLGAQRPTPAPSTKEAENA